MTQCSVTYHRKHLQLIIYRYQYWVRNNASELFLHCVRCSQFLIFFFHINFSDMDTLQQCIVRELNTCEETTPANIVEALLNYVRNETPCGNMTVSKLLQAQRGTDQYHWSKLDLQCIKSLDSFDASKAHCYSTARYHSVRTYCF